MYSIIFNIMFTIVPILVLCGFIFTIATIISPKLRSKFMSKQIKATKYMIDENEEILKDIATTNANISKDGIEITARVIKDGLTNDTIYCKHCGKAIDEDSKFCKHCGQEQ